jgi:hypothetical protein
MSTDWFTDIKNMHAHYGVHDVVDALDNEKLSIFRDMRIAQLSEELSEFKDAKTAEEAVDALIDLCVFAIGTLDLYGVDAHRAWNEVLLANMRKVVGVKTSTSGDKNREERSRLGSLGLPDLIKMKDWKAPDHTGNHGLFAEIY